MTVTVILRDTAGEIPFDAIHKNAPASDLVTAGIDIDVPSSEKSNYLYCKDLEYALQINRILIISMYDFFHTKSSPRKFERK